MAKRHEITEQTRANLITAFWELLAHKRIDKITIKEITNVAGYYRSTFYEYFTDIYDLSNQVEASIIEESKKQVTNNLSNNSLDELIYKSIAFYNSNSQYLYILLGNNGNPAFANKLKNALRPKIYHELNLQENNIQAEYMIEFALSAILGTVTHWFERNKDIPIEELIKIINHIIKNGVIPAVENIKSPNQV